MTRVPLTLRFLALLVVLSGADASQKAMAQTPFYAPPERCRSSFQITGGAETQKLSGQFDEATGSFSYHAGSRTLSRLRIAIGTGGLNAGKGSRARAMALFDAKNAPEITFVAMEPATVQDGKIAIRGILSLNGKSKPASFDGVIDNAARSGLITLAINGQVKREDFGLVDDFEGDDEKPLGETLALSIEMNALGP